jgi:hypothetical protein
MPLHDWTRVPAGLFHDFHQSWSIRIKDALNAGLLPQGTVALVEQRLGPREADILTIDTIEAPSAPRAYRVELGGGVAVQEPPAARIVRQAPTRFYAERANRIVVRHHLGRIIAVIEIVSPGNKDTHRALRNFVEKTAEFLYREIHVLVVDLFPPTPRDPFGIHKAIWDELADDAFEFPPGKDRIVVSYNAGYELKAYIEPITCGDTLPDMPLFLTRDQPQNLHVIVPLESTYQATWDATPQPFRSAVETGQLPNVNGD